MRFCKMQDCHNYWDLVVFLSDLSSIEQISEDPQKFEVRAPPLGGVTISIFSAARYSIVLRDDN